MSPFLTKYCGRVARVLPAAAVLLCAGPALALSCLQGDPVNSFARANAATEVYVAVLGKSGGPGERPEHDMSEDGQPRSYIATFTGHTLNRDGPFESIDQNVIVEETCAGPWCGEMEMETEVLAFLQVQPGGPPIARVGPCYGDLFFNPTEAQREAVRMCFVNGCTES